MSLTNEMYKGLSRNDLDYIDPDWLAGAITGLNIAGMRSPSYEWDPFLEDIEWMNAVLGGVNPVDMSSMEKIQSYYDFLGGYISMTGTLCSEGLRFRTIPEAQIQIRQWLSGLEIVSGGNDLLVPNTSLMQLINLVPLRGPVEDQLIQEGRI
jgi:hypothetical protein